MTTQQIKILNSQKHQAQYEQAANFTKSESEKMYFLHLARKEKSYQMEVK